MALEMFLTTAETAKYLGYSDDAIRKSRVDGRLSGAPAPKFIKLGYRVKYSKADLVEWVAENSKLIVPKGKENE